MPTLTRFNGSDSRCCVTPARVHRAPPSRSAISRRQFAAPQVFLPRSPNAAFSRVIPVAPHTRCIRICFCTIHQHVTPLVFLLVACYTRFRAHLVLRSITHTPPAASIWIRVPTACARAERSFAANYFLPATRLFAARNIRVRAPTVTLRTALPRIIVRCHRLFFCRLVLPRPVCRTVFAATLSGSLHTPDATPLLHILPAHTPHRLHTAADTTRDWHTTCLHTAVSVFHATIRALRTHFPLTPAAPTPAAALPHLR